MSILLQAVVISMFLFLGVLFYIYLAGRGITHPSGALFPMTDAAGAVAVADSDDVFAYVATQSGLPLVVGVLFVLGSSRRHIRPQGRLLRPSRHRLRWT